MTASRIRAAVALAIMMVAFAVAHAWRPTARLADMRAKIELEELFPRSFGSWAIDTRMPVQLISPDTQAVLDKLYNQTLTRTYVNAEGQRIMLSVAYGGDQSDATRAHRPEVCYPAQGFQILGSSVQQLPIEGRSLRVRQLLSKLGSRVEPISYWITVGERIALSGTEQKLAQLSYSTRGVVPDGMLVRVSSIDSEPNRAYQVHRSFIASLAGALAPEFKARVIGQANQ